MESPAVHNDPLPYDASVAEGPTKSPPMTLRWWPAALLLALMAAVKFIPQSLESPPLPVLMLGFLGPAIIGLGILVWWLFASRAGVREKLIGLVGLILVAVVAIAALHPSMKGMAIAIFSIPAGVAAFALALIVFSTRPASRVIMAVLVAAGGFGVWNLFQSHGVTGKFATEFDWRWNPTPEEVYLKSLADNAPSELGDRPSMDAEASDKIALTPISRDLSAWSDFRGPKRDGTVDDVVLAEDWSAQPPKLVWRTLIGPGWSSFTVAGNRLFTQEQRGDDEAVVCLNRETGETIWACTYPGRFWESVAGAGPRATPTIGEDALFALGGEGKLLAIDPDDGSIRWERDLRDDAGRKPPEWGFASSPLLVGDLVLVHAGGSGDRGVLAYEAETGSLRWSAASGDHSYSSPQVAEFFGVQGVLMMTNAGLQFLDAASGDLLWDHAWPVENYRAIQPLVTGKQVLIATSLGEGTRRITVQRDGETWSTVADWTSRAMKPDFNDYVVYEGRLYGFDGNLFACVDLDTGERLWKRGRYGNGQVVLLSECGQLLVMSEMGDLVLLQANPEKLIELGKVPAIEGKTWNHPVLIGNRVYVRNGREAACFELPEASPVSS